MKTFYGWVLLTLIVFLNQFAIHTALKARMRVAAAVLLVAVPVLAGFALYQVGVRLLGGAP